MRKIIIAAAFLLCASAANAFDQYNDIVITAKAKLACSTEEIYDAMLSYADNKEFPLWDKIWKTGACTIFKQGEHVIRTKGGVLYIIVRRYNHAETYYMSNDGIDIGQR